MTLYLAVANGCEPSGRIVEAGLREAGVTVTRSPTRGIKTVSWGVPGTGGLNGGRRLTKYQALEAFAVERVPCPEYARRLTAEDFERCPVWYARKAEHARGSDIRVVCDPEEAGWRLAAGWDHFTARLPITRELRAWVFGGRLLALYRKDMVRPAEFTRVAGRGHLNGFAFNRIKKEETRDAKETHAAVGPIAVAAVRALALDFGAVDVIDVGPAPADVHRDGRYRVLEVNTAPGIDHRDDGDPVRGALAAGDPTGTGRYGARALIRAIAKWSASGSEPRRV